MNSTANDDNKAQTLRSAIDEINRGVAKEKGQLVQLIRFADGIKGQTITLNTELLIKKKMTIDGRTAGGQNQNVTITRDAMQGDFRLFEVGDGGDRPPVNINYLTLKGGDTRNNTGADAYGGAILSNANLVLTGCTIRDNSAASGGGIYAQSGTLDVVNCEIFNNQASFGGGIYIDDYVTAANLTGGSIHDNQANVAAFASGGIFILGGENVPINVLGVSIHDNWARFTGGGIAVSNNQAAGGSPQLTLNNDTVIANNYVTLATSKGGGVYLGAGSLLLLDVGITGNGAALGGGLYAVTGTWWGGDPNSYGIWDNVTDDVHEGA